MKYSANESCGVSNKTVMKKEEVSISHISGGEMA
jgi:hypothetical protein